MKVLREIRLFLPFTHSIIVKLTKHKTPSQSQRERELRESEKKGENTHQNHRFVYLDFGNTCFFCIDSYTQTDTRNQDDRRNKKERTKTTWPRIKYRLRIERFYFR